jgi:hypothetical protein
MSERRRDKPIPRYQGSDWLKVKLPTQAVPWLEGKHRSLRKRKSSHTTASAELTALLERDRWKWPKHPIYFFADPHADADAMLASLVASGGIKKTGPRDKDFELTKSGKRARFIVGGDCFDKGPSSLRLLRMLRRLAKRGARMRILAGNHDVRIMLGMRSVGMECKLVNEHFFIRMGVKAVPFLKEIQTNYLQGQAALRDIPGNRECRRRLYPSKRWYDEFASLVGNKLSDSAVHREMRRIEVKIARFEDDCEAAGLSMRMVYAAALKWRQLFLHPRGEFYWFFANMHIAQRRGSFLFIHAGLDDGVAELISEVGVRDLNRRFRRQLQGSGFEFYYGSIANALRTKYRAVDMPLSRRGVELAHNSGIHAIVHGHRNLLHGQRIALRKGIVNFECDITMDRNSRKNEGLKGHGAGVTVVHPDGWLMGISTDYPQAKIFEPDTLVST